MSKPAGQATVSRGGALAALLLAILILTSGPARADERPAATGVAWEQLTPEQQTVLRRFEPRWAALPPARQSRLAAGTARWSAMPPDERAKVRKNFHRFRQMSPEQRHKMRQRWRDQQKQKVPDT